MDADNGTGCAFCRNGYKVIIEKRFIKLLMSETLVKSIVRLFKMTGGKVCFWFILGLGNDFF